MNRTPVINVRSNNVWNVPQGHEQHRSSAYLSQTHRECMQGYLPGQLYKLDSSYGNKEQLTELTAALKAAGLRPVADIVINHRCADQQDENGIWNMFKCAAPCALNPEPCPSTPPAAQILSHISRDA